MTEIKNQHKEVLDRLPDTRRSIADDLGITIRACRYRMEKLEEQGYDFERDSDGVWRVVGQERGDKPWRVDSYDKAQATREINNELLEIEKEVKEALGNVNPVVGNYDRDRGASTLVIPHSDAHIGAVINERYGVDYYSAEEAKEAVSEYFDRCIHAAKDRGDVEDACLILNGDMIDGEGIYPGQRHEQDDGLRDQLRKAGNAYIEQILKLAREFEFVNVFCVPGNHGNISKRSTTNADMMLYDFVETALAYSGVDNVNIEKSGHGGFLNFDIRGWNYFTRHGEDYLEHVGTSSGIRRALNWYSQYNFDVALRSHYHTVKYECVADEVPIIMTGSPAPPSTFAESKASDGGRCGVFWFATEDAPIEGFQPVRLNE